MHFCRAHNLMLHILENALFSVFRSYIQSQWYQKSFSVSHRIDGNGFCIHDSAIPTITKQIYQRISETMNAKGWHEKAGISRFQLLPFRVKRGRSGQWNTSHVKYVRGYERSSICPLSTIPSPPSFASPSPSGRAAGHSPFLSLVQFKENACRGHAPIHSYRFASLVDTQYLSASLCEFISSKYGILSYDTDCIPENCSTLPSMRSLIFCPCCFITI